MAARMNNHNNYRGILVQFFSAYFLTLPCFLTGFHVIWSINVKQFLQTGQSPIGELSASEVRLIEKLPVLTIFLPALVSAVLTDIIGRKKAKSFYGICYTVAWVLISTASCSTDFIVGYIILCICYKMDFVTVHAYISEISQNSIRGTLLSLHSLQFCFGILMGHLLEIYFSYELKNYFCLTISTLYLLIMPLLEESPAFLLMNGKEAKALESLKFYRGAINTTEEITNELYEMNQLVSEGAIVKKQVNDVDQEQHDILKPLRFELNVWQMIDESVAISRALNCTTYLLICISLCGSSFMHLYTVHCIQRIFVRVDDQMCSMMAFSANFVGSLVGVLFIDVLPRRVLFIWSSFVCTICMFIMAIIAKWHWSAMGVGMIVGSVHAAFFQAGVRNVALVQMAESFSPRVKCTVIGFANCCTGVCNLIMITYASNIIAIIGTDGILFLTTLVCYMMTIYAFFFLKETKDKPIQEIMKMYEDGYLFTNKTPEKSFAV